MTKPPSHRLAQIVGMALLVIGLIGFGWAIVGSLWVVATDRTMRFVVMLLLAMFAVWTAVMGRIMGDVKGAASIGGVLMALFAYALASKALRLWLGWPGWASGVYAITALGAPVAAMILAAKVQDDDGD